MPPLMLSVIPVAPLVSRLTRMFSIDCAVRAQLNQVSRKAVVTSVPVVSNMLAGKAFKLLAPCQAALKFVPEETSIEGKLVRPVQIRQVLKKFVPEDILSGGKTLNPVQLCQHSTKFVPEEVSIAGKAVNPPQLRQALLKFVPEDVSIC